MMIEGQEGTLLAAPRALVGSQINDPQGFLDYYRKIPLPTGSYKHPFVFLLLVEYLGLSNHFKTEEALMIEKKTFQLSQLHK